MSDQGQSDGQQKPSLISTVKTFFVIFIIYFVSRIIIEMCLYYLGLSTLALKDLLMNSAFLSSLIRDGLIFFLIIKFLGAKINWIK